MSGQNAYEIDGRILNTLEDVDGISVVNRNTGRATVTNTLGAFKITVRRGDTLELRAVQFHPEQVFITQKVLEKAKVEVFMTSILNALDEVKISNSYLTGEIKKDAVTTGLDPKKINNNLDKNNPIASEYRRLHTATSRPSDQVGRNNLRFDLSLDRIINTLSGKTKRLKKAVAQMEFEQKVEKLRNYYADRLFVETLNIPQELIDDFSYWVLKDSKDLGKIDLDNRLETLEYLIDQWSIYKILKDGEASIDRYK